MYSANSQQVCNYLKLRTIVISVLKIKFTLFNCLLRKLHCGIKIEKKKIPGSCEKFLYMKFIFVSLHCLLVLLNISLC